MERNVADQKFHAIAFNAEGRVSGVAASISCELSIDGEARAELETPTPVEIGTTGEYVFSLTQAETDGHALSFTPTCSEEGVQILGSPSNVIYTDQQSSILTKLNTSLVFSLILEPGQYCNRDLVSLLFGETNLIKWANLEEGNTTDEAVLERIEERITLSIMRAEDRTNQLLLGTRYAIPISPVTTEFAAAVAGLAGSYLYESRGALEFDAQTKDAEHQLSFYRIRYEKYMRALVGGKVRLNAQDIKKQISTTPSVG